MEEGTPIMMKPWKQDEWVGQGILIGMGLITFDKETVVNDVWAYTKITVEPEDDLLR